MRVEADDAMLAETREFNSFIEQVLAGAPSIHTVDPVETRRQRALGEGVFPAPVRSDRAQDRTITADVGELRIRVIPTAEPSGLYLHFHGGGWVLGTTDQQDVILEDIATRANLTTVSVEYRLAPEHPYPAAADDTVAATEWVLDNALEEFGTDRIVMGGESAGAHLVVLTLMRLRDKGLDISAVLGANLCYGAYDLGGTPSRRRWGDRNLILSEPIVDWFLELFTPGMTAAERQAPELSPMFAEVTGLPPALFTVGDLDMLHDDSVFMHALWSAAGIESRLDIYPESIHGFNAFPTRISELANGRQIDWIRAILG